MRRYFLDSDGDSRNYIVPEDRSVEWDNWLDLDEDDPDRWVVPTFAEKIEGGRLSFENPAMDGELLFEDKNLIEIFVDDDAEMASVWLNGECRGSGNYWDFHNGGLTEPGNNNFGIFNCYNGFAANIALTVGNAIIKRYKYSYELNQYYR